MRGVVTEILVGPVDFSCSGQGRETLRVNMDRVKHWQGKGAQLTPTAQRLVKQFAKKAA